MVVAAVVIAVAALLVVALTGDAPSAEDRQAATCRELDGDLLAASPDGGRCEAQRTAFTVETVLLTADGDLDAADRSRRRTRCAADAVRARARAVRSARTRTVTAYDSFRWVAPGVCRATRATLPVAEARASRADRLLSEAGDALTVDPEKSLRLATQADDLAGTAESRAAIAAARRALRPAGGGGGTSTQLVSPNEYLGIPCSDIGRAFRVAPGSDPAHDPDGDGRACEGE